MQKKTIVWTNKGQGHLSYWTQLYLSAGSCQSNGRSNYESRLESLMNDNILRILTEFPPDPDTQIYQS